MAKKKEYAYACQACGSKYPKWSGQCTACGEWNCIEEINIEPIVTGNSKALNISALESQPLTRIQTNIQEFNHVCGGGIVPGSVILIGGEPGIGKSTLLIQICNNLKLENKPLYISGEEAASQVAMRAKRLGLSVDNFQCAFGTNLSEIYNLLEQSKPGLVIIDSIQTMHYDQCDSGVGTVGQIRACSQILTQWAKTNNIPIILVGHITKEGALAGPKILEHMVDVVLYFEGERTYPCRILRAVKNRFGPTDEVGIFEMEQNGLQEISNPSKFFLDQAQIKSSGVVIFPSIEGSRPLLIELQALTLHSNMQMPRRSVVGWDQTRLSMIAAVIETKLNIKLSQKEIYINIVGGLKVIEPATDLAAALAIISAQYKIPLPKNMVAFGEIGLSGEIRPVTRSIPRLKEASKLGIKLAIVPNGTQYEDMQTIECTNLNDVLDWLKSYHQKHKQTNQTTNQK